MEPEVLGTGERIAVNNIVCLGRNYRAHAEELGNPVPERPVIFLKPNSCLIPHGGEIVVPRGLGRVHHEVELAAVIGKGGKEIPEEEAMDHVLGYAVMLDITARDLQGELKKKGLPWTLAKGYDTFGPISDIRPRDEVGGPGNLSIKLEVNGEVRQDSNTSYMIFKIPYLIQYISRFMTLRKGDVIATGTPEGVWELVPGDVTKATIEKVGVLENYVVGHGNG